MDYNLISNVESCHIQLPHLLYYSHWPSIIISLFFGFFVFLKSGRSLLGKILLAITISYSLWAICDLVVWITVNSMMFYFFWSFFEILSIIFYFLIFYFGYVFIEEKDISPNIKLFFLIPFFPVAIISSTEYYLAGFNAITCDAIMNDKFLYYIYILKGLTFLGVLILFFSKYVKYQKDEAKKAKIIIGGVGLTFFLISFLITQYFGDFVSADLYRIEFYGLFAVDIFIGFLVYLIVKHKTFNIKLLGAEALVAVLVILIGSQFAFIQNRTNQILTGITLVLSLIFGVFLVRSVRKEVATREKLEVLTHELEHANAELKELDKTKSEFMSIVSHQLRTPLSITKGYVSMILEGIYGEVSDKIKETLQKVYVSNDGLIALVNNLLDLSRMEAGTIKYEFKDTDLVKMVDETVTELELEAQHRNLYLKWAKPTESMPLIKADEVKLKQVIEILIENSIKYTQQGGAEVFLTKDNNSLLFKVKDTGIGVDPKELDHLFNKFGRGVAGSKVNATGVGLGLYAAKQIVLAHKGEIWVESEGVGKGSSFCVRLMVN